MRFLIVLGVVGCGVQAGDSAQVCAETTGTIYGTVLEAWRAEAPTPAANARLQIEGEDQQPIDVIADEAGAYSIDLQPGNWSLSATSADEYCMSMEDTLVSLSACQLAEVDVSLTDCVLKGR